MTYIPFAINAIIYNVCFTFFDHHATDDVSNFTTRFLLNTGGTLSRNDEVYASYVPISWGIHRISDYNLPVRLNNEYCPLFNGTGATVYLLDTGVNKAHV